MLTRNHPRNDDHPACTVGGGSCRGFPWHVEGCRRAWQGHQTGVKVETHIDSEGKLNAQPGSYQVVGCRAIVQAQHYLCCPSGRSGHLRSSQRQVFCRYTPINPMLITDTIHIGQGLYTRQGLEAPHCHADMGGPRRATREAKGS